MLFLGGLCQCIYFSIAAAKSPFGAMMVGFGFAGTANSYLSGQSNVYVSSQKSAGRYLGWLHGCYGIGAFASPLLGQILLARGWTWPQFFIISTCLAGLNTLGTAIVYHTTKEEFQEERSVALQMAQEEIELEDTNQRVAATHERGRTSTGASRSMMATITHPIVWIFAAFLCLYNGSETTNGGWIVAFLLKERNANPKTVGYVASGFWGGLALGRILIGQASPYIGIKRQKHLVHIYLVIALTMTILVWKIPSFLGNAFCTALVGFVLGPIYPISLTLATKLLPVEIHMTALATMSSCAQMGSAICPFITGVLANARGVGVLQPILLAILSLMAGLWCLFPTRSI
ncbi:MFS general substrate transporter [Ceratobasidium sp. AG-I]|nr:MFS general substrate transporter [Ceratobasidium sp. AG-I]